MFSSLFLFPCSSTEDLDLLSTICTGLIMGTSSNFFHSIESLGFIINNLPLSLFTSNFTLFMRFFFLNFPPDFEANIPLPSPHDRTNYNFVDVCH